MAVTRVYSGFFSDVFLLLSVPFAGQPKFNADSKDSGLSVDFYDVWRGR